MLATVDEVEPLVGQWRRRFDSSASAGVPAHVTVLFPFLGIDRITTTVVEDLRTLIGVHQPFTVRFEQCRRFPDVLYLAPAPDGPFDYYSNFIEGGQYPRLCRRPRGGGQEQILLDGNAEAEGKPYWDLGTKEHSPDHKLLAYAVDDGRRLWSNAGVEEAAGLLGGSTPAVLGNVVVAAYTSGELLAFDVVNGNSLWTDSLAGRARRSNAFVNPPIGRGHRQGQTRHSGNDGRRPSNGRSICRRSGLQGRDDFCGRGQ